MTKQTQRHFTVECVYVREGSLRGERDGGVLVNSSTCLSFRDVSRSSCLWLPHIRVARVRTPNMYVLCCEKPHVPNACWHVLYRSELLLITLASQSIMCYSVHIIAPFLDDLHNIAEKRCLYLELEAFNLLTVSANSLGTQCCKTVWICVGECLWSWVSLWKQACMNFLVCWCKYFLGCACGVCGSECVNPCRTYLLVRGACGWGGKPSALVGRTGIKTDYSKAAQWSHSLSSEYGFCLWRLTGLYWSALTCIGSVWSVLFGQLWP